MAEEKKKHMADGRPALVIGAGPSDVEPEESEGSEPDDGVTDADGLETMRAFHEASAKGDHAGMWDALKAAVKVASGAEDSEPERDDAVPEDIDGEEAIGEH